MAATIDFPRSTITRSQYDATQGQPLHRLYALIQPIGCPACGAGVRTMGFADWVKNHGTIITLWACTNSDCDAHRYDASLRLTTDVVSDAAIDAMRAAFPRFTDADRHKYLSHPDAQIRSLADHRDYAGLATRLDALHAAGLVASAHYRIPATKPEPVPTVFVQLTLMIDEPHWQTPLERAALVRKRLTEILATEDDAELATRLSVKENN